METSVFRGLRFQIVRPYAGGDFVGVGIERKWVSRYNRSFFVFNKDGKIVISFGGKPLHFRLVVGSVLSICFGRETPKQLRGVHFFENKLKHSINGAH